MKQVAPKPAIRDDGTPYYLQLEALIRRRIVDQNLKVGDRLPTLKELVSTYGVSSMTVRHALARLEEDGLIRAERGRGTFITDRITPFPQVPYFLTRSPGKHGAALSFRMLALRDADNELRIAPEEGIPFSEYKYMKRVFSRNGAQFIVGEYLIVRSAYELLPERSWSRELVSTLLFDNREIGLSRVRQTFRVIAADPDDAEVLGIRINEPVVIVRRIFQNARDEVICLAQLVYRTDGVVFDINIDTDSRDRLLELGGFPES